MTRPKLREAVEDLSVRVSRLEATVGDARAEALRLMAEGVTDSDICERLGIARRSLQRYRAAAGISRPKGRPPRADR